MLPDDSFVVFDPPRRQGLIFQSGMLVTLTAVVVFLLNEASTTPDEVAFLAFLFGAVLAAIPLPAYAYRLYALIRSGYGLERDGIRLAWGLRQVDIPMDEVLWVESADDFTGHIGAPRPSWPGGLTGTRLLPDLGPVEFMAADMGSLVLIGTTKEVFAISPEDRPGFLKTYQRQYEHGSLRPIPYYSSSPTFLLTDIWRNRRARLALITAVIINLGLFVWVGIASSQRFTVSLGFTPDRIPLEPVPAGQLYLLPTLSLVLLLGAIVLAGFFHRREDDHPFAYLMWISSIVSSVLFGVAILFILQSS